MIFPKHLAQSGYNTAGYGKILHLERNDRSVWNFDSWENNWYEYQANEMSFLNSSTMPDKHTREEDFRDYKFATRAIQAIHDLSVKKENWMVYNKCAEIIYLNLIM